MPIDPYFAGRLRRHRRYLLSRARAQFTLTLRRIVAPVRALLSPDHADDSSTAHAVQTSATGKPSPASARSRHRWAALAWDRDELATAGVAGPDIPTSEHMIAVDGYPDVKVRVYRPAEDGRPRPAVLYFYGGAFRIGGIDYPTTDATCRRRAADADIIVVAVSYALAPEHKFPTQVEQGYAALEWLVDEATSLGVDPNRIAIAGTSAGGAIAAAVSLANRDRNQRALRLQVLEVPVTDLTGRHIDLRPTWAMGVPSFLITRELRSIARTYLRTPSDARHPYASPLRATDHAGLPPALILTAEYDNLRGDGAAYGAALRRSDVPATVVRYLGVGHDTPIHTAELPAGRSWHTHVVAALRELHA